MIYIYKCLVNVAGIKYRTYLIQFRFEDVFKTVILKLVTEDETKFSEDYALYVRIK